MIFRSYMVAVFSVSDTMFVLPFYIKPMSKFNTLYDFIDAAERSRKYPSNTAQAYKAALRLFETELNDEERESLDKVMGSIDQIYRSVINKNSKNISLTSLATYKSRFVKVLMDYDQYGVDPTKMANWNVKTIVRNKKAANQAKLLNTASNEEPTSVTASQTLNGKGDNINRIELSISLDRKCYLIVPRDVTVDEAKKIRSALDLILPDKN